MPSGLAIDAKSEKFNQCAYILAGEAIGKTELIRQNGQLKLNSSAAVPLKYFKGKCNYNRRRSVVNSHQ